MLFIAQSGCPELGPGGGGGAADQHAASGVDVEGHKDHVGEEPPPPKTLRDRGPLLMSDHRALCEGHL